MAKKKVIEPPFDITKQYVDRIKFLENHIKDLRIAHVKLEQRNDALLSALVRFNLAIRDRQRDDPKFLEFHRIHEGLSLAD